MNVFNAIKIYDKRMKLPPTLIKVLKKLQYTGVPITQRESCKIRYLLYKRNIVNKAAANSIFYYFWMHLIDAKLDISIE